MVACIVTFLVAWPSLVWSSGWIFGGTHAQVYKGTQLYRYRYTVTHRQVLQHRVDDTTVE